jgi:hypothetical protein
VASSEKRNWRLRWYARYRDPAGAQLVKVFARNVDAGRFLTTVEGQTMRSIVPGVYPLCTRQASE